MELSIRELEVESRAADKRLDRALADYEANESDAAYSRYCTARDDAAAAARALNDARNDDSTPTSQRISVSEPDRYQRGGPNSFIRDMYLAQVKGDPSASRRVNEHHEWEVQKRALTTSTFGGLIPPDYLLEMYAKALRNGRVFADQVNHQPLPEYGMSLIVPRLTTGLSAAVQSSENSAVSTQDIVETDLTIGVETIGGYSPVSRQSLERGMLNEDLLFEDLTARIWAALDVECLNGSGSSPHFQGIIGQSGIKTSAATGSSNLPAVYANIADVVQQINSATGGLGYVADKIVMHPRRWGSFVAAVDNSNRPILGISGYPAFNVDGVGQSSGYGYVGTIQGLQCYVDANVPTNLGAGSNEDVILVFCSGVVHLWEDQGSAPITLRFDQQAGTSLEVMLAGYQYAAFSAGRYPAACGKVTGLVPPTFGS